MSDDWLGAEPRAELEAFAVQLARAAASATVPFFRGEYTQDNKAGPGAFDPVTEADRAAEAAIRKLVRECYPDHGVLGEEEGGDHEDAAYVWVVDPIDGTRAFISGLPLWTTLIGLRFEGRPRIGLISQPVLGELYIGDGHSARLMTRGEVRPIRSRSCLSLSHATVSTTDPELFSASEMAAWGRLRMAVRLARLGCDAYAYAMVAAGSMDLVLESGLKPWDYEPLIPVLQGAGGGLTGWDGGEVDGSGRVLAFGDRGLAEAAMAVVAGKAEALRA